MMIFEYTNKWWLLVISLIFLGVVTSGVVLAQAGTGAITVNACTDQNANGLCTDLVDAPPPADVEACLNDDTNCQAVPATFTDLAAGDYTVFLQFTGASQGYYPTTGTTAVTLADGEQAEVTLGAVYPVHPKGVAVHEQLNKVYVAFQGPIVLSEVTTSATQTIVTKPYPFVAVIDGDSDEVLYTIPGGEDGLVDPSPRTSFSGIGREPWGVAISGDGQFVYVGSYGDGLVTFIDPISDTVLTNYFFGSEAKFTAPAVNPVTGLVGFPDYQQGHLLILNTDPFGNPQAAAPFIELPPTAFSPFEMVTADALNGYNFVTLRDAVQPGPFKIAGLNSSDPFGLEFLEFKLPDGSSGPPHAIGLWQQADKSEPRLFVTYADDPRDTSPPPDFVNPNNLAVFGFPPEDPKNLLLRNSEVELSDYAEVGLVYDPLADMMRGTYAGFAYIETNGDEAACDNPERGGTYGVNFDGGILPGFNPDTVVGNPPLSGDSLQFKNPFEIAVNPNNGKIYVTDRCWNDFPEGGQPGGGAVLIFHSNGDTQPTPTPTITPTSTITPTPTITPTTTPTATQQITLAFDGPALVAPQDVFSVEVVAQNVPDPGLYGVQLEVNYDPVLISASNLQVNPDLSFVLFNDADNVTGKITLVASRQGNVPGLTGDVTLLTFDATAADTTGTNTFTFEDPKIGDPSAQPFDIVTQSYSVTIETAATPTPETPTATPTATSETPTATPETPTATPTATSETPTATPETPTATPSATSETPTATPETPTATPTATSETPTATPETPTATPTAATETPTATPETPTATPTAATVSGQVILAGRAGNDWSDATVVISDTLQSDITDAAGNFSIADVSTGAHDAVTADAAGYLSAVCGPFSVTGPATGLLPVTLLSGDINDDDTVDITDATAVGADFGSTGPGLAADINRDEIVDIFDIILVSVNFGESGPQAWTCQ